MQEAADRLGISRVTLWRKLKDHRIERPGNGGDK
jgi:transcriptional regulator of acetoin/glycerol metabolism